MVVISIDCPTQSTMQKFLKHYLPNLQFQTSNPTLTGSYFLGCTSVEYAMYREYRGLVTS